MTARFSLVGIVTADMGRSLAFYRRLGLDIPEGAESEGHVEVTLPGRLRLAWDTVEVIRSFDPDFHLPEGGGHAIGLAFEVDAPAEVDALYADLTADYRGTKEPWDAVWGQRYAQVQDPDGNTVDLFAALPDGGGADIG